jgi:hypothetical protein
LLSTLYLGTTQAVVPGFRYRFTYPLGNSAYCSRHRLRVGRTLRGVAEERGGWPKFDEKS